MARGNGKVFHASCVPLPFPCVGCPEKACRDEDFVGQLEAALSEWCAVLSAARRRNSDDGDGANDSNADGPLREIHAWRARQSDLRGLVAQPDDSGMRAALDTLERFVARGGGHVDQSALLQRVQSSCRAR